jgi:hypothetical protein
MDRKRRIETGIMNYSLYGSGSEIGISDYKGKGHEDLYSIYDDQNEFHISALPI